MKYRNPKTNETRTLGGSNVNAQARALEALGWELVRGKGLPEYVPAIEAAVLRERIAELEAELKKAKSKIRRLLRQEAAQEEAAREETPE